MHVLCKLNPVQYTKYEVFPSRVLFRKFRKTHVDRLLEQKTSTETPWWIMHAVPTL